MDKNERHNAETRYPSLMTSLFEEVPYHHGGIVHTVTLRKVNNGEWSVTATAVGERGTFYVQAFGRTADECFEMLDKFLQSGLAGMKWRKSSFKH